MAVRKYQLPPLIARQHNSLPYFDSYPYTLKYQIIVATTPHQRSFSLQQTEPIPENQNWTHCRDQQLIGSLTQTGTFTRQLLHLWLREHLRRE